MFKKGFTLAEVIITLGVIGVISALTIPTLIQDTSEAEIEPKLNKARSAIMQANKALLYEYGVDRISETGLFGQDGSSPVNTEAYMQRLGDFIKISSSYNKNDDVEFEENDALHLDLTYHTIVDGVSVALYSQYVYNEFNTDAKPHMTQIGTYVLDVNGRDKPNARNKDIYYFEAKDDGSMKRL